MLESELTPEQRLKFLAQMDRLELPKKSVAGFITDNHPIILGIAVVMQGIGLVLTSFGVVLNSIALAIIFIRLIAR